VPVNTPFEIHVQVVNTGTASGARRWAIGWPRDWLTRHISRWWPTFIRRHGGDHRSVAGFPTAGRYTFTLQMEQTGVGLFGIPRSLDVYVTDNRDAKLLRFWVPDALDGTRRHGMGRLPKYRNRSLVHVAGDYLEALTGNNFEISTAYPISISRRNMASAVFHPRADRRRPQQLRLLLQMNRMF